MSSIKLRNSSSLDENSTDSTPEMASIFSPSSFICSSSAVTSMSTLICTSSSTLAAISLMLSIRMMNVPTNINVTVTAPMDATDIHPLRITFLNPSRKCRFIVLKFIAIYPLFFISYYHAVFDCNDSFFHSIYDLFAVGRHDDGCTAHIYFLQYAHDRP